MRQRRVSGARRHRAPEPSLRACLPATAFSSSSLSSSSSSSSGDGGGAASPRRRRLGLGRGAAARGAPSSRGTVRALVRAQRGRAPVRPRAPVDAAREHLRPPIATAAACASWGARARRTAPPRRLHARVRRAFNWARGRERRAAAAGPTASTSEPTGSPPHHLLRGRLLGLELELLHRLRERAALLPRARKDARLASATRGGGRSSSRAGAREGVPSRSPVSPSVAAAAMMIERLRAEHAVLAARTPPRARNRGLSRPRPPAAPPPPRLRGTGARASRRRRAARGAGHGCGLRGGFLRGLAVRGAGRARAPAESRRPRRPTRGESRASRRANPTPRRRPPPPAAPRASDAARGGDASPRRAPWAASLRAACGPPRRAWGSHPRREHVENMSRLAWRLPRSLGLDDRPGRRHRCVAAPSPGFF